MATHVVLLRDISFLGTFFHVKETCRSSPGLGIQTEQRTADVVDLSRRKQVPTLI